MEAKRTIRSYIGPGVFGWVVLGLFLLGALLCALTGRGEREVARPAPVAYDQVEDPGEEQDVFLDVIAISEAICPFSDSRFYYVAEDDGHQFHVVCLSEDELAGLENQRAYWNNSGTEPTFSRLVGRKYPIPDEVKQSFLSVFAMEGAAFDAFFGDRCLITQPAVTARKAIGHPVGFALFGVGRPDAARGAGCPRKRCGGASWRRRPPDERRQAALRRELPFRLARRAGRGVEGRTVVLWPPVPPFQSPDDLYGGRKAASRFLPPAGRKSSQRVHRRHQRAQRLCPDGRERGEPRRLGARLPLLKLS